jgi:hypothetical protein
MAMIFVMLYVLSVNDDLYVCDFLEVKGLLEIRPYTPSQGGGEHSLK